MNPALKPSRSLVAAAAEAIREFDLIRDGDRILVGLSGGKDSLSLLHVLLYLQQRAPVRFAIGAANIDPQMPGYDPSPLAGYAESLGVPYYQASYSLARAAKGSFEGRTLCAFCSRMRRGKLYGLAREHGYGTLALAHHLDDVAETFLMNAFFGGKLRAMPAAYTNDDGDLRVIRPLVYARERQTEAFANSAPLPVIPDNCPTCDSATRQRQQMKAVLGAQEASNPRLFTVLRTTLAPLLRADATGGLPMPEAVQVLADLRVREPAGAVPADAAETVSAQ
jgi:tRNA 2-thiocytidine biosynthesis protein TtcA